jgi:hypothetical protein
LLVPILLALFSRISVGEDLSGLSEQVRGDRIRYFAGLRYVGAGVGVGVAFAFVLFCVVGLVRALVPTFFAVADFMDWLDCVLLP